MKTSAAVAVMFTFSFGSAMAAAPSSATNAAAYTEAVDYALTVAGTTYDKAVADGLKVPTNLTVSAEAWAAVKANYLEIIKASIELDSAGNFPAEFSNAETILAKKMNTESTAYALFGHKDWYASGVATINSQDGLINKAAKAEYKIQLDEAYDLIANKIDLAAYSGDTLKAVKAELVNIERELNKTVDGVASQGQGQGLKPYTDASVTADDIKNIYIKHVTPGVAGGAMAKVAKEYWNETVGGVTTNDSGTKYETGLYLLRGYDTDADKAAGKDISDAQKASLKAIIAKNAATYLSSAANQTTVGKEIAAAYQTVLNYLIDEGVFDATNTFEYTLTNGALKDYRNAVKDVDELKAFASKYAAERNAEGTLVRDAKEVQDIVDAATLDIYVAAVRATGVTTPGYTAPTDRAPYTLVTAKTAIVNATVASATESFNFDKKVAVEAAKAQAEAYAEDCYALEAKQVDSVLATAVDAFEAATKAAEIEQAQYNFERALKAIKKKTAIDAAFDVAPIQTEIAAQATVAKTYIDYVNTGKTSYAADRILYTDLQQIKDMLEDYYIEQGARTAAEVKAMALDAAAIAAMLPTTESKAAALKAAEDAVKALPQPSKVTVADQSAIESAIALVEAAKDAGNTVGSSYTTKLSNCIDMLENALKTELLKEYAKADKADKAALRAVQGKIDEFNKLYKEGGVLEENENDGPFAISGIQTNLNKIMEAEKKAVIDAINALPINVTEADKAQVEAARKLYDAYVADWTKYTAEAHNAASDITNFRTLALAEATLGLNAEDPAMAVKAFKIKASSKATKGAMTIKWRVIDGDKSAAAGYQVWRSTKANKGFKKMITTKKMTYKNTKNLKKGTTYYYRVRAYARTAEGKLVFSDYSNKAYRKAK